MERRAAPRIESEVPVTITILGNVQARCRGHLVNASTRGISARVNHPLAKREGVKLEAEDQMFVGRVVYCKPSGDAYLVGISLTHKIPEPELEKLRSHALAR
ncbi:MAG: PilZ domain-containing protein [Acidobacteriota bacterium]|nr:PilZ domain-containing protein [Acidobacteriota bacterium]